MIHQISYFLAFSKHKERSTSPCTKKSIEVFFTIVKNWREHNQQSIYKRKVKKSYIVNWQYYGKNCLFLQCWWVLNNCVEWRKPDEKRKYTWCDSLYKIVGHFNKFIATESRTMVAWHMKESLGEVEETDYWVVKIQLGWSIDSISWLWFCFMEYVCCYFSS